ncbi:uncharacterized protein [Henckelia pumila]|uniref:uncharacterized protein n=1 Tax=Henckelia pumila TaxID=405737 RepID=UPI003C6DF3D6
MANRLNKVINYIISEQLNAFIFGRSITDNVIIAFEISHYLKCKRIGKKGASLKIDMSKATNLEECKVLKDCIRVYEEAYGQMVNFDKSSVSFSANVINSSKSGICEALGVRYTTDHGQYMGLSSLIGRNKSDNFAFIKEKAWRKMNGLKEKMLSRAVVVRGFEMFDEFVLRKDMGGLGFKKLHAFNLALLAKQGWKLLSDPNALASRVLKARYFPHSNFLDAKIGHNPSYVWRILLMSQDLTRKGAR